MRHRLFMLGLVLVLAVLGLGHFEPYQYQRADFDPYYGQDEMRYLNGLSRQRVEDYWRNVRNAAFHKSGGGIANMKYNDSLRVVEDSPPVVEEEAAGP